VARVAIYKISHEGVAGILRGRRAA